MKLGRAAAAIGILLVTTVLVEGKPVVAAPLGTSRVSQRPSTAGNLISQLIANATTTVPAFVAPAANLSALPQASQQTCGATEAALCREAVIP